MTSGRRERGSGAAVADVEQRAREVRPPARDVDGPQLAVAGQVERGPVAAAAPRRSPPAGRRTGALRSHAGGLLFRGLVGRGAGGVGRLARARVLRDELLGRLARLVVRALVSSATS